MAVTGAAAVVAFLAAAGLAWQAAVVAAAALIDVAAVVAGVCATNCVPHSAATSCDEVPWELAFAAAVAEVAFAAVDAIVAAFAVAVDPVSCRATEPIR